MAQILLHGTLHATIFEAESLSNPHRATGGAPKFIRKVLPGLPFTFSLSCHATISSIPFPPRPTWHSSLHQSCQLAMSDAVSTADSRQVNHSMNFMNSTTACL